MFAVLFIFLAAPELPAARLDMWAVDVEGGKALPIVAPSGRARGSGGPGTWRTGHARPLRSRISDLRALRTNFVLEEKIEA